MNDIERLAELLSKLDRFDIESDSIKLDMIPRPHANAILSNLRKEVTMLIKIEANNQLLKEESK